MFNTRNESGISAHPCIILYVIQIVIFIFFFHFFFILYIVKIGTRFIYSTRMRYLLVIFIIICSYIYYYIIYYYMVAIDKLISIIL